MQVKFFQKNGITLEKKEIIQEVPSPKKVMPEKKLITTNNLLEFNDKENINCNFLEMCEMNEKVTDKKGAILAFKEFIRRIHERLMHSEDKSLVPLILNGFFFVFNLVYIIGVLLEIGFNLGFFIGGTPFIFIAFFVFSIEMIFQLTCNQEILTGFSLIVELGNFLYLLLCFSEFKNIFMKFLALFLLLRLKKQFKFMEKFKSMLFTGIFSPEACYFFRKCFDFFLFLHLSTCLWGWIEEKNFDKKHELINLSWYGRYIESLYFVSVAMAGNGGNGGKNLNHMEMVFCLMVFYCFLLLIGHFFYQTLFFFNNLKKVQCDDFENFFTKNEIPIKLKAKALEDFNKRMKNKAQEENLDILLKNISKEIKDEILEKNNEKYLKDLKFLNFLGKNTIKNLSFVVKQLYLEENDRIPIENDKFYIVKKGKIEISFFPPQKTIKNITNLLERGGSFNACSLFLQGFGFKKNFFFMKPCVSSQIIYIEKEDFLKIIRQNPSEYEKYCSIRDKFNILQDFSDLQSLGLSCYLCQSPSHMHVFCPLLKFNMSRSIVLSKYLKSAPNDREYWKRRAKAQHRNTLVLSKILKKVSLSFAGEDLFKKSKSFDEDSYLDSQLSCDPSDANRWEEPAKKKMLIMDRKNEKELEEPFESVQSYEKFFEQNNVNNVVMRMNKLRKKCKKNYLIEEEEGKSMVFKSAQSPHELNQEESASIQIHSFNRKESAKLKEKKSKVLGWMKRLRQFFK